MVSVDGTLTRTVLLVNLSKKKKMHTLKQNRNFTVKYLRGDNAGKNESFLMEINGKEWDIGVTPEWMPYATL